VEHSLIHFSSCSSMDWMTTLELSALRAALSDAESTSTVLAAARRREESAIMAEDSAIDDSASFRSRLSRLDSVLVRAATAGRPRAPVGDAAEPMELSVLTPPSSSLSVSFISIWLSLYITYI